MKILRLFFLVGFTLTTACLPLDTIPLTATPAPTESPLPTATIVWFPPSATPIPPISFATQTVAPQMDLGIGETLFADDFSDAAQWDVAISDQGSVAVSRNRLAIVAQPGFYLASLRRSFIATDFYAEITVRANLCRAQDTYGVLFRAMGNSFYRFVLSCNGLIHVERIVNGVKLTIVEAVLSGDAPLGAPGQTTIGVWAAGAEMRFFLNSRFQFSVMDKSILQGGFGVFARSAGETPTTITFSDLIVRKVNYTAPTQTPSP